MSARLARVLVTTGAAALALGLVAPSAALADSKSGDKDGSGASSSSRHHGGKHSKGATSDPAGNNGTIKIQPYGGTSGSANSPHPGCDFRLQMFGFDADQTGTITFVGQAPTKGAVTAQPLSGSKLLSNDAAGGGKDVDAFYDVRGASLGLTGTPAKQGFHVKVLVDADNAPGGAKQKVFWLDCPAASDRATGATGSTTTKSTETTQSTESATSTDSTVVAPTKVLSTSTGVSAGEAATGTTLRSGAVKAPASGGVSAESETSDVTVFTGGAAAATRIAPRTSRPGSVNRGTALPFTGIPVAGLLALAASAVVAGALAIRAGRRRTSAV
ncbi:MAG: hypothetical protein LC789_07470 [Actinobacteria bacterium]|nr:hypothetical protein [Actinomycetota bacterium]MCA1721677.1 hypothetical protein [Actinomycetota bacterium]